jgi:hypothetical protein
LANHFPRSNFGGSGVEEEDEDIIMAIEENGNDDDATQEQRRNIRYCDSDNEDDDDDDGPVVVASEDIQASKERSSGVSNPRCDIPFEVQRDYPVLSAAVQDHEDIMMTCARALDEKKDVSLVREAAAYLEEIERRKF